MRKLKYSVIRLLRVQKGARSVSLGLVAGFFPCWFPTFGIGPAVSIALTKLFGGSVMAAIVSASVGSFLWPVLFYMNYFTGALLKNREPSHVPDINYDTDDYLEPIEQVNTWGEIGMNFAFGAAVNSVVFSIGGYVLIYYLLKRYRERMLSWIVRAKKSQ